MAKDDGDVEEHEFFPELSAGQRRRFEGFVQQFDMSCGDKGDDEISTSEFSQYGLSPRTPRPGDFEHAAHGWLVERPPQVA